MNAVHPMQIGGTQQKTKQKTIRKKPNPIKGQEIIDYLDSKFLTRFTNDQGKLLPRRITGISAYQQRKIAQAVKYARHLALLPYVAQDVA